MKQTQTHHRPHKRPEEAPEALPEPIDVSSILEAAGVVVERIDETLDKA